MGIFGDPQDQVDLDHLKDRVARLEAAVAVLQQQAAERGAVRPRPRRRPPRRVSRPGDG